MKLAMQTNHSIRFNSDENVSHLARSVSWCWWRHLSHMYLVSKSVTLSLLDFTISNFITEPLH